MISPTALCKQLNHIFADQTTVFKTNFAFGFISCNTETGALQYHHPSANNNLVLDQLFLVSDQDDLERAIEEISNIDFLEWVRQQRPNSKWVVDLVTNVTWVVWKLRDHPIGLGSHLPGYIAENHGIAPLDCNRQTGRFIKIICVFSVALLSTTAVTQRI